MSTFAELYPCQDDFCLALPGSYKQWYAYLRERLEVVRDLDIKHSEYESLNNSFERALVTMHKMPRIWVMYLQTLMEQRLLTQTRRTFDRALCALPVTQHERIWELYLNFVSQKGVPIETALRVYRRYLKFDPTHIEEFIEFLVNSELWQEAAETLAGVLNDDRFYSIKGKTKHQLWLELCDLVTNHAEEVSGLKVDAIIRQGIRQFTDEVGRLWTSLAGYYIRRGLFEKARDIFEEGMTTVVTVRDFSVVFDAYLQFEYSTLVAIMKTSLGLSDEDEDDGDVDEEDEDGKLDYSMCFSRKKVLHGVWLSDDNDVNLRLAHLKHLIDRRPELANSVRLRQNPHNVEQWHRRVKLFKDESTRQLLTYSEAVRTVDPMKAVGKPHTLWVAFAKLYGDHKDVANARVIFGKAVQVSYKDVDDLVSVWCEWAEMELKNKNYEVALELMRRATAEPSVEVKRRVAADGSEPVQMKLHKSLRLWTLYVDLEESGRTLESTRVLYERILDLKIATPQIIINYASLLEEHKYFEDAFKVYERGVKIFKYPHARDIWVTYLSKFVKRYGKSKLERARELFEQAVQKAPAEDAKPLYLEYAKLEMDFGLAKHAMKVYNRAAKALPDNEKVTMYELYIARAAEIFGLPKTREIYEQAIQSGMPDKDVEIMCMKYADLEKSLGEIDRARAVYVFASKFCDLRSDADLWSKWHDFEVQHGNEDTFREMLRIKRSVSTSNSQTDHGILTVDTLKRAGVRQLAPAVTPAKEFTQRLGFVSAGVEVQPGVIRNVMANQEDIELLEDDDDGYVEVNQKDVPIAVYGHLAQKVEENRDKVGDVAARARTRARDRDSDAKLGALERIKRQRQK